VEGPAVSFNPLTRRSMEALPSPLSSRPERRDLQFNGPFLEMFFDRAYPDFLLEEIRRAKWRDFVFRRAHQLVIVF
jgi:hypothetical protein